MVILADFQSCGAKRKFDEIHGFSEYIPKVK